MTSSFSLVPVPQPPGDSHISLAIHHSNDSCGHKEPHVLQGGLQDHSESEPVYLSSVIPQYLSSPNTPLRALDAHCAFSRPHAIGHMAPATQEAPHFSAAVADRFQGPHSKATPFRVLSPMH